MHLGFIGISPITRRRNAVTFDLQPQVEVVAEGVLDQRCRVRKVSAVIEGAGLDLVFDDVDQVRGLLPVGRGISTGQKLPVPLAVVTKIDPHRIATGLSAMCHIKNTSTNATSTLRVTRCSPFVPSPDSSERAALER